MLNLDHISGKKLAYACFDWGFGHVSRSISILLTLEKQGNTIYFCGKEDHFRLVQQYGFQGKFIPLQGANLQFSGNGNFVKEGLKNALRAWKSIRRDHQFVESWCAKEQFDLILSDHRYGFYSRIVPSIFITHQVHLPAGTPSMIRRLHQKFLHRFSSIWILDNEQNRLGGVLTAHSLEHGHYVGLASRFKISDSVNESAGVVAIVSGPEPYSNQFFELIESVAKSSGQQITVICARQFQTSVPSLRLVSDWKEGDEQIRNASIILSRNGYSTLMDVHVLNKKALLLATPGQLEQYYLATYTVDDKIKTFVDTNDFKEALLHLFVS